MSPSTTTNPRLMPPLALVTGAARGIGLQLVTQLVARGYDVIAVARHPSEASDLKALAERGGITIIGADVTVEEDVAALASCLADRPIDLLFNNAGVWGGDAQSLGNVDFVAALHTFNVNALAPLRVTLALLPRLRASRNAKIVNITSGLGSIAENTSGGNYAYRMSKAALNMASKSLAVDLRRYDISSVVINPGWVKTDMGGDNAQISAAESVQGILRTIDKVTLAESGNFYDWRGTKLDW